MRKNIIFALMCAIAVFICAFALASPPRKAEMYNASADVPVAQKLTEENIVTLNNCTISDGRVTVTGGDAYIIFRADQAAKGSMFVLEHSDPEQTNSKVQVYYADETGEFSEAQTSAAYFHGSDPVVIDIPDSEITYFRLDIDCDYTFRSLNFYASDLPTKTVYYKIPLSDLLISIGAALVFGGVMFVLASKFSLGEKITGYIKAHYVRGLLFLLFMLGSAAAAFLIEAILVFAGFDFSIKRALLIFAGAATIAIFIFFCKDTYKNLPAMTAAIILTVGTVFIYAAPMAHISWDTESHYEWAVNTSYMGDVYLTQADLDIEKNAVDFMYNPKTYTDDSKQTYNERGNAYISVIETSDRMISSLPSGIFLALGRLMNLSFYARFCLGKLANLICYALLAYFTVRKIRSGRVIAAIILLFPTNLFLATNYAYDWWVTGFIMLGMACFVNECQQQDKPVTVKDTLIMCGAFAIGCIPKLIYAPLLFIPFFMHKKNFNNKKMYYALCTAVIVVLLASLLVRGSASVSGGGDTRGGAVSVKGQAKYILANPLWYAKMLFKYLSGYLSVSGTAGYINNFAYMGHTKFAGTVIALLIVAAVTDKSEIDRNASNWLIRTGEVFMLVGMAAIIATVFYLDFTPVGKNEITGCQPRYLLPMIYPFVALIGYGKSPYTMDRSIYAKIMLAPVAAVMLFDIASVLI